MTAHGASCLGCGHPQVTDWFLDRMTADVPIVNGVADRAAVSAAVKRIEANAHAERVAYFSGTIQAPPAVAAAFSMAYARHEAAHAVVGILAGVSIIAINIDTNVVCHFGPAISKLDERTEGLVLLAGDASRLTNAGIRCWPGNRRFCAQHAAKPSPDHKCDTCLIFNALALAAPGAGPAAWQDTFSEWLDEAIRILRRPRVAQAVAALAAELVTKGHLDGATVHAIVEHIVLPADRLTPPSET